MITNRQAKLLQAIIDEFILTAEAVGSNNLATKYRLGVSPATIRNEMADLVRQGYLEKPHTSSGRIPTNLGFKYFVQELLQRLEELEIERSQNIFESLFQIRFDKEKLIREAINTLATHSGNASFLLSGDHLYFSGLSNLINYPEYEQKQELQNILNILEDTSRLFQLLKDKTGQNGINILIGEECGIDELDKTALIFTLVKMHGTDEGYLAVIGPNRMNYYSIIPLFSFVADSLQKVVSGWR
jgi:heat-inducible transcriptional repressor